MFAGGLYYALFTNLNQGILFVLVSFNTLAIALLSRVVHNERINNTQFVGMMIMIISPVIMAFSQS